VLKLAPLAEWTTRDVWYACEQLAIPLCRSMSRATRQSAASRARRFQPIRNDPRSGRWAGRKVSAGFILRLRRCGRGSIQDPVSSAAADETGGTQKCVEKSGSRNAVHYRIHHRTVHRAHRSGRGNHYGAGPGAVSRSSAPEAVGIGLMFATRREIDPGAGADCSEERGVANIGFHATGWSAGCSGRFTVFETPGHDGLAESAECAAGRNSGEYGGLAIVLCASSAKGAS